jgi:uncharacterized membrane protein
MIGMVEIVRGMAIAELLTVLAVYLWAAAHKLYEYGRVWDKLTKFQKEVTVGNLLRMFAIVAFLIGTIQSHIDNFHNALTLRGVMYIIGGILAFLAWVLVDRHKWYGVG